MAMLGKSVAHCTVLFLCICIVLCNAPVSHGAQMSNEVETDSARTAVSANSSSAQSVAGPFTSAELEKQVAVLETQLLQARKALERRRKVEILRTLRGKQRGQQSQNADAVTDDAKFESDHELPAEGERLCSLENHGGCDAPAEHFRTSFLRSVRYEVVDVRFLPFSTGKGLYRFLVALDKQGILHFYDRDGDLRAVHQVPVTSPPTVMAVATRLESVSLVVTGHVDGTINLLSVTGPARRGGRQSARVAQVEPWEPIFKNIQTGNLQSLGVAPYAKLHNESHERPISPITSILLPTRNRIPVVLVGDASGRVASITRNGTITGIDVMLHGHATGAVFIGGTFVFLPATVTPRFFDLRTRRLTRYNCSLVPVVDDPDEPRASRPPSSQYSTGLVAATSEIIDPKAIWAVDVNGNLVTLSVRADRSRARCQVVQQTPTFEPGEKVMLTAFKGHLAAATAKSLQIYNTTSGGARAPLPLEYEFTWAHGEGYVDCSEGEKIDGTPDTCAWVQATKHNLPQPSSKVSEHSNIVLQSDGRFGVIAAIYGHMYIYEGKFPITPEDSKWSVFNLMGVLRHPMVLGGIGMMVFLKIKKGKEAASKMHAGNGRGDELIEELMQKDPQLARMLQGYQSSAGGASGRGPAFPGGGFSQGNASGHPGSLDQLQRMIHSEGGLGDSFGAGGDDLAQALGASGRGSFDGFGDLGGSGRLDMDDDDSYRHTTEFDVPT